MLPAHDPAVSFHVPSRWNFRTLSREPLLHFLLIGLLLALAYQLHAERYDRFRIVMTPRRAEQLAESYRLQHGSRPEGAIYEALLQRDLDDEVLYREALALGLDREDEVIRRRLIQKMRFLSEDLSAPVEPTAAQLDNYFETHRARYRDPPRASFGHAFFSGDVHGDDGARERAERMRQQLEFSTAARPAVVGDPFPDNYDFAGYETAQVERIFGRSEFSAAVFTAPVGRWTGPFRSAYGWHLLRIDNREPASDPPFAAVEDAVRRDYLEHAQASANAASFARLKQRYHFVMQDTETAP